ncbi:multicopper oxidase [Zasmidium cellare ATCC 36951]|uniref:Multicopper oxidase n=1 Tax=Zasmidium cellare ATCC 36951 TaxID=1080233 RepID=A0A6A6C338_ZASCE|nr:multicopper oxidase [Zasmidium cellare ATCC 36951]KAF2160698.1 multicopper oxidase [Zasmidium cellare ATCC 36951]
MPSLVRLFAGAALLATGLAIPSPQAQFNVATSNLTDDGNQPASTQEQSLVQAAVAPLGGAGGHAYHTPAWLPFGQGTKPQLSQSQTNGRSNLGTFQAPRLPWFIGGGPTPQGFPWGGRTAKNTNYYDDVPNTGITRRYDFAVSAMTIAPDGVEKQGLVINGAFPGPTIEANWGDWFEITVHNNLDEGTSLHWHGLLQKDTPWFDGVPGVMQCPIAPGSSFTYRFRADLYGTSWYHSHYSAQYAGGLFGPMIIHGPKDNAQYDVDLGPVMVNDWFHKDYFSLVEQVMAPAADKLPPPFSNNVLINGKMNYPCVNATGYKCTPNAGVAKFSFESGKSYRLRVINAGAEGIQKFSVDNHQMTVIANDFVPIVPYTTDVLTLAIGQRSDVVVKATGKSTDAVWMRSTLGPSFFQGGCSLHDGVSPTAVAAIYYEKANATAIPQTQSSVSQSALTTCQNDDLSKTQPYYPITPPSRPQTSQNLDITFNSNGTHNLFFVNNSTFRVNYNDPVLLDAKVGNYKFPSEYNVFNFHESNSIRLVIYNHAQTGSHPMHMHGHNMYILAEGTGTWDGSVVNAGNPQRRDVHILPNAPSATEPTYIVVQIDADNPGVWPLHCHIAWHVSGGLYVNILERPRDIRRDMQIPSIMAQTCRDWSTYTGQDVVEQIDSGL